MAQNNAVIVQITFLSALSLPISISSFLLLLKGQLVHRAFKFFISPLSGFPFASSLNQIFKWKFHTIVPRLRTSQWKTEKYLLSFGFALKENSPPL